MSGSSMKGIEQTVEALGRMTVGQLREKYLEVFGEPSRSGNRDFLFKRLAWRIQSLAEGTLSERARRRANDSAHTGSQVGQAAVAEAIAARAPHDYRVFVDSGPVLEKALARNAGLGWIGKHTNLIAKDAGSYFFIGEILTDLPLTADEPASAHCGTCTACMPACPTGAITAPQQLDAGDALRAMREIQMLVDIFDRDAASPLMSRVSPTTRIVKSASFAASAALSKSLSLSQTSSQPFSYRTFDLPIFSSIPSRIVTESSALPSPAHQSSVFALSAASDPITATRFMLLLIGNVSRSFFKSTKDLAADSRAA